MRGFYPGGGINIGPAIVFSYIAVREMTASAGGGSSQAKPVQLAGPVPAR
jgi:hypothetical protein